MRSQLNNKSRKNVFLHWDLNHGPLASVLLKTCLKQGLLYLQLTGFAAVNLQLKFTRR